MKKTRNLIALIILSVLFVSCGSMKNFTKKTENDYANAEYNYLESRKKELKEEGWKYDDDGRTLDLALLDFRRDSKGKKILVGHITSCQYDCLGDAQEMAAGVYAASVVDKMKVKIERMSGNQQGKAEMNGLMKAFEKKATVEIGRILKRSYSIYKPLAGGGREFKTFFIIGEEEAFQARKRALQRAVEEAKLTKKFGEEVEDFINREE